MPARERLLNWVIFLALSFIWGSSFILMKVGMNRLSAYQVAALRLFSAGIVLVPYALGRMKVIPAGKLPLVILSGLLGSFFPAFLFCIAEIKIDSSLTGILNALTPISTIICGALFFKTSVPWRKTIGIITGFAGLCLLFLSKGNITFDYLSYALLVILATICYGVNVNMVSRYLKGVGALNIAAFAFSFCTVPSFLILYFTGFFRLPFHKKEYLVSAGASVLLGIVGTALASIIFYVLLKRAGVLFSSLVTYGIPFVAIFWGLLYGEGITIFQVGCLGIILGGVFLSNR